MDLWAALGISPQSGVLALVAGIGVACVVAVTLARRRSRETKQNLGLGAH